MKRKGFTLIELLAVIILLGIIATIVVINYNRYLKVSKLSAFRDSMHSLIEQLEEYKLDNRKTDFTIIRPLPLEYLNLENKDSLTGSFKVEGNYIVLVNVTDGFYCANGNKNTIADQIVEGDCN